MDSKLFIAILLFLIAYYYPSISDFLNNENNVIKIEHEIINSWKYIIKPPEREKPCKFSIGLNTNVDLITAAIPLLQKLNTTSEEKIEKNNHAIINSIDDFKQAFAYFFDKGSAAERFFSKIDDFNRVIESTENLDNHYYIGGNAALMAQSIVKRFNVEVMLVGPIGPKLKNLLNNKIKIPNEVLIDKDEVHLILEYHINEEWANIKSPHSNRFIISHDIHNSKMDMLDMFFNLTFNYDPNIIILAGLHLLESQNELFRTEKLKSLKLNLEKYNKKGLIHLELASIGDQELMKSIINNGIFNEINSLGLNEQELLFFSHAGNGPHENYYKEINGVPDLYKIIDKLEWLLLKFGNSTKNQSKLTRVHFHYLMYHIIALTDDSLWSNTEASLLAGTKVASKQACDYDFHEKESDDYYEKVFYKFGAKKFEVEKNNFLFLNSSNPILRFKRSSIYFYLTPVLVCKKPLRTVGLGDAISSTGLFYAKFNN